MSSELSSSHHSLLVAVVVSACMKDLPPFELRQLQPRQTFRMLSNLAKKGMAEPVQLVIEEAIFLKLFCKP